MPQLTDQQKAMVPIDYLLKRKKAKNDQPERSLQKKICDYLQTHYPNVYFFSDPSGIKLSPGILRLLKATRSRHTQLDLIIIDKKVIILEIKAKSPFQKNKELFNDPHLKEQQDVMIGLSAMGHISGFVWTLNGAIELFTEHLGEPVQDLTPLF